MDFPLLFYPCMLNFCVCVEHLLIYLMHNCCLMLMKNSNNCWTAGTIRSLFGPFVELVKSWSLPEWLVHWGHPGNMVLYLLKIFQNRPYIKSLSWSDTQCQCFISIFFLLTQAVVLFAMGGYGAYLGFRIRYSDDVVSEWNIQSRP